MSLENEFREMIRRELATELGPVRDMLDQLRTLTALAQKLGPLVGVNVALPAPARRGPGRPPGSRNQVRAQSTGRRGAPRVNTGACAIAGCSRPPRSKGYCAAHYQKYRNLSKSGRLPSDWTEFPAPGSVKDLVLPRGRAASKALQARA